MGSKEFNNNFIKKKENKLKEKKSAIEEHNPKLFPNKLNLNLFKKN